MYRIIDKLRLDRYVNSRLILALDLFVSMGATIVALLLASILLGEAIFSFNLMAWWLGGALSFLWQHFCFYKPISRLFAMQR